MPFRINHIHIKAVDPRKAADWWVSAFGFRIVSDETRPFGDRFVRCEAEGGALVNFSNARTGETLAPGSAAARFGLEHLAIDTEDIEADIARLQRSAPASRKVPSGRPTAACSPSSPRPMTCAWSWWSDRRRRPPAKRSSSHQMD